MDKLKSYDSECFRRICVTQPTLYAIKKYKQRRAETVKFHSLHVDATVKAPETLPAAAAAADDLAPVPCYALPESVCAESGIPNLLGIGAGAAEAAAAAAANVVASVL